MRPTRCSHRALQLVVGLVVAVEHDALHREPGVQRDVQLTAGRDVEPEALLGDEARHRRAEERLARVRSTRAEPGEVLAAPARAARPRRRRTAACRTPRRARRGRRPPTRRARRRSTAPTRGKQRRIERRGHAVGLGVLVDAGHLVGRVHAEQPERVGEPDPARLGQPEPRLGQLRSSVGEHPAVAVEAVERARRSRAPTCVTFCGARVSAASATTSGYSASARSSSSSRSCVSSARSTVVDRPALRHPPPRPCVRSTRCARARTARSRRGSPSTAR